MRFAARAVACTLAVAAAWWAGDAAADCAPSNPFEMVDRSPRVAVVRAGAAKQQFSVRIDVERVIKGSAEPRSTTISFNPMVGASLVAGRRYLVFLTNEGGVEGGCSTVDMATPEGPTFVDALTSWTKVTADPARAALLVQLGAKPATSGRGSVAFAALDHLAGSPALLGRVTASDRSTLVKTVPSVDDDRAYALSWVLARLHATESIGAWLAFLDKHHSSANHRPIRDALELMTNHDDPQNTGGRDIGFDSPEDRASRDHWRAWLAANQAKSAADLLRQGSRERRAIEVVPTDQATLARIVQSERDDLTRKVALAACEQLVGARTSLLGHHAAGYHVSWDGAKAVCPVPPKP